MKSFKISAAVFFTLMLAAGCSGGDGSGNGIQIVLSGTVLNNHTNEDATDRSIAGAKVLLVKAGDAETVDSVSPVEDLAYGNNRYPIVTSDSHGYYRFTPEDFSDAYPSNGKYFVYVDPPASEEYLLPGGTASRASIAFDGKSPVALDIILTDTNGPNANYIGSTLCLICHPQKKHINHTLHFVGIRKIGPQGTIANGSMDMNDTSVYDLSANNDDMLDHFTNPATRYTFADDASKSFWLGKDDAGFYFQLTLNTNPKFYIKYSYGGETGLWKGQFMTTVYAGDGTYAANHGPDGNDYAYYVMSPIQYNENSSSIYGEQFVTYHADRWDFAGTDNNAFTADPEIESFDLDCAACHGATGIKTINKGMATERKVAVYTKDPNGYDIDGINSEINIGCEKCHGPGSNHLDAGGQGEMIIAPDKLPSGRLTMICGTCHTGGKNHTDAGGGVPLMSDGNGNYETFRPGMNPARFFGTADGTGKKIAPFGTLEIESLTGNGYLEPINYETNPDASWTDMLFGADVNHSKANQQHYEDFVRSVKIKNHREILTCISCHDAHGSSYKHMVIYNADTNAVCLPCHYGPGQVFPNIDSGMISRLKNDAATPADKAAIGANVEAHMFDKTGSPQMNPYDPEGSAIGRCTLCHMPRTGKSADWSNALVSQSGQYRQGDITAHTFDVMATEAVNAMMAARGVTDTTPAGITDKCGKCHVFAGLN